MYSVLNNCCDVCYEATIDVPWPGNAASEHQPCWWLHMTVGHCHSENSSRRITLPPVCAKILQYRVIWWMESLRVQVFFLYR
jgi:hypothetical protein